MALVNMSILFALPLLGGALWFFATQQNVKRLQFLLIFGGGYLFGITFLHLLPALLQDAVDLRILCAWMLAGFLVQHFLEHFTIGVAHGHIHGGPLRAYAWITPYTILGGMCVHALFEGMVLVHDSFLGSAQRTDALLWGVGMHKIPAAFALVSVLGHYLTRRRQVLYMLCVFALFTPLGMLLSHGLARSTIAASSIVPIFALVCGSFLHISTTIFFETAPRHIYGWKKNMWIGLGVGVAALAEYVVHLLTEPAG